MIALDVEDSVPTYAIILERDLRVQLHQLFVGKLLSQTRIQILRNIRGRICHRISELNHQSFGVTERCRVLAENSTQLFIAQVCFSAHGRIDIYSERTIDARRGARIFPS